MRLTEKSIIYGYIMPTEDIMGNNQGEIINFIGSENTCRRYIIGSGITKIGKIEDFLETLDIDDEYCSIDKIGFILNMYDKKFKNLENLIEKYKALINRLIEKN